MAHDELAQHCVELLQPLGAARSRRMFGGHGIYVDDLFVALIIYDRLYLKADAHSRAAFEAAGCEPFVYDGAGKQVTVSYWSVPADAMESPALMQPWAGWPSRPPCAPGRPSRRPRRASPRPPARPQRPPPARPAPRPRATSFAADAPIARRGATR